MQSHITFTFYTVDKNRHQAVAKCLKFCQKFLKDRIFSDLGIFFFSLDCIKLDRKAINQKISIDRLSVSCFFRGKRKIKIGNERSSLAIYSRGKLLVFAFSISQKKKDTAGRTLSHRNELTCYSTFFLSGVGKKFPNLPPAVLKSSLSMILFCFQVCQKPLAWSDSAQHAQGRGRAEEFGPERRSPHRTTWASKLASTQRGHVQSGHGQNSVDETQERPHPPQPRRGKII